MILRFPAAQGVWVGSASMLAGSVVNSGANVEGVLVYDGASKKLKLCDGQNWQVVSHSGLDDLDGLYWDAEKKYLGIGTSNLSAGLTVSGAYDNGVIRIEGYGGSAPLLQFRHLKGAPTGVQQTLKSDELGRITWLGYGLTTMVGRGGPTRIATIASEDFTDTVRGTDLSFWITPNGQLEAVEGLCIKENGNVGIGVKEPAATLDVKGFAKLALNTAPPVSCTTAQHGSIALTKTGQMCVCRTSNAWRFMSDNTACDWSL